MDFEETMVEQNDNAAMDDTLPEDIVESTDESEESLESFIEEQGDQPEEEKPEEKPQETGTSEPGWIKKRVEKAVNKAIAETEARMQAMFEQQMAPLREQMLTTEAEKLVRQGIVKDLETAKELVRYRQGMGMPPVQEEGDKGQPRNAQGQFTKQESPKNDPATSARIDMLQHQADRIKANGGPDVIAEFKNNEEIRKKVIAGEMDFYEVAEQLGKPKKRPPAPMRSPNGASGAVRNSIESMSDAQFKKLDKMLDEGVRFTIKR